MKYVKQNVVLKINVNRTNVNLRFLGSEVSEGIQNVSQSWGKLECFKIRFKNEI